MSTRYISVSEHETIPVGPRLSESSLTEDEADALSAIGLQRPGFCTRGYKSVRLAQYCGIISLGDRLLEILPKVAPESTPADCRGILLRLLKHAGTVPLFKHLPAGQSLRRASLLEFFVDAFLQVAEQTLRAGLLRGYESFDHDLPALRGRLLLQRQAGRLAGRPDILACQFDDFTADNQWNRILKAGLSMVRPHIVSADLGRRWLGAWLQLDEVTVTQVSRTTFRRLVFDRRASRYKEVIRWVEWIVNLLSPALRAGDDTAPALLVDMNQLFERAVVNVLRARLSKHSAITLEAQMAHVSLAVVADDQRSDAFRLRPDICLVRERKVIAIADTKWKRVEFARSNIAMPSESDFYQMAAYARAFGCTELTLLYPVTSGMTQFQPPGFELPAPNETTARLSVIFIDVEKDDLPLLGRRTLLSDLVA